MSKNQIHIWLLVFLSLSGMRWAHGQNLIPNPGFEELFTQLEYQWVQPQGPYYHYQRAHEDLEDGPLSGNYENGLCMYSAEPNEYLHVKLLKPLVKGKKYRLEVNARLMRTKSSGNELQNYIGVYFGKEEISTHVPGDIYFNPQINLKLPEGDRFEWFQMVDTFTAMGGETRFTMGYFPKTQWLENREEMQEAFFNQINDRYEMEQKKQLVSEDKSWLYMPPAEQKKYLKELKKKRKRSGNKNSKSKRSGAIPKRPKTGADYSQPVSRTPQSFAVRYYFDDLCLAALPIDDIEATCRPENLREGISKGKVINLRNVFFQTDSATLRPESTFQLEALYRMMQDYPNMRIEIRGYTDNVGDPTYNLALSDRRAKAVSDWLTNQGIASNRMTHKGFGKADP